MREAHNKHNIARLLRYIAAYWAGQAEDFNKDGSSEIAKECLACASGLNYSADIIENRKLFQYEVETRDIALALNRKGNKE